MKKFLMILAALFAMSTLVTACPADDDDDDSAHDMNHDDDDSA
jgi:hypothetical protein